MCVQIIHYMHALCVLIICYMHTLCMQIIRYVHTLCVQLFHYIHTLCVQLSHYIHAPIQTHTVYGVWGMCLMKASKFTFSLQTFDVCRPDE